MKNLLRFPVLFLGRGKDGENVGPHQAQCSGFGLYGGIQELCIVGN